MARKKKIEESFINPPIEIENEEYGTKTYVRRAATPDANYTVGIYFTMKSKKPIKPGKDAVIFNAMRESFIKLEDDYVPGIEVEIDHCKVLPDEYVCSGVIYVTKKFAKDHLYFNRKFSPEKYLGFYLSRLARNLRKKDKYFATKFNHGGMFTYEFFY